jgi:hypothetical protein
MKHKLTCLLGALLFAAATARGADDVQNLDPAKLPRVKPPAAIAHGQTPLRVKVLVLEFNPLIPGKLHSPDVPDAPSKGLREVAGWNDPIPLAAGYMQDLCDASDGLIQYEIVEWLVVRRFQKKTDGFVYTPESYMECLRGGTTGNKTWHSPDGVDYPHMIDEFKLIPLIESGKFDEVWMMGLPYFGYWESCMAGKDAFYVNGGVYDQVPCKRRFVIMGFNVERDVAEMIHDLTHRAEATLSRVYGGWKAEELTSHWARFAANQKQSGTAAVGTCHYPPNAESDYDYANERPVESTADDWLHYPDLTGRKRTINCEEWSQPYKNREGRPDYHRNYQRWWFTHLPKAAGVNADGRLNNWWEYIFNFNAYDASGKALPHAEPVADPDAQKAGYRRPA